MQAVGLLAPYSCHQLKMTFVENKRKELRTSYKADTPEVGVEMGLRPQGQHGIKTRVNKRERTGIG